MLMFVSAASFVFLSRLNAASQQAYRDQQTMRALKEAKEALLGRAIADANRPGSLPCPDTDNDGSSQLFAGPNCPSYVGRLPFRTIDMNDLRDGSGERLWYAMSSNYKDYDSGELNSDTPGLISVDGNSDIVAVVVAPGGAGAGQNRVSNSVADYLEDANSDGDTSYATSGGGNFNDRIIIITRTELMAAIEQRIAREATNCLDAYAIGSGTKYPFPEALTAPACGNVTFGRISGVPDRDVNVPSSDPDVQDFQNDLDALQAALNDYVANPDATTNNTLQSIADDVKDAADSEPLKTILGDPLSEQMKSMAEDVKDVADNLPPVQADVDAAQDAYDAAITAATTILCPPTTDGAMLAAWPAGCFIAGTYWDDWQNLVFYQVADGYKPGSAATCGATCLTINGTGSYRATVLVAGQSMAGQDRSVAQDPPANYLEESDPANGKSNVHTGVAPVIAFETYRRSDTLHTQVNDLVLCMDGNTACN